MDAKYQLEQLFQKHQLAFEKKQDLFVAKLQSTMDALSILCEGQEYIENFEVIHGSMEDAFLKITDGEGFEN